MLLFHIDGLLRPTTSMRVLFLSQASWIFLIGLSIKSCLGQLGMFSYVKYFSCWEYTAPGWSHLSFIRQYAKKTQQLLPWRPLNAVNVQQPRLVLSSLNSNNHWLRKPDVMYPTLPYRWVLMLVEWESLVAKTGEFIQLNFSVHCWYGCNLLRLMLCSAIPIMSKLYFWK